MNDEKTEDPWKPTLEVSSPDEKKPRKWGFLLIVAGIVTSYLAMFAMNWLTTSGLAAMPSQWQLVTIVIIALYLIPTLGLLVPGLLLYVVELIRGGFTLRESYQLIWAFLALAQIASNALTIYQVVRVYRETLQLQ